MITNILLKLMIAALLLGRKGSKGFLEKYFFNIRKLLAWYPMKTAKSTSHIDQTYLSTDDPELWTLLIL